MERDHTNQRAPKTNNPATETAEGVHHLSESEAEEDEESLDQQVINVDNVNEDEVEEVAEEDPTFSPVSELNRRAKRASKKKDNLDPAQITEPVPPTNKKAPKIPKKSPAGSTPSFKQQKLNFTGANTPASSAPLSILNQI